MPSTYTVNLGIEKPATGEQSGTWGDTTNVNFDIIDQAVNGSERVTLTSAGTSGSPNDLNIVNGSTTSSEGRNKWIEIYSASDLGGSAYVRLVPNDAEKILFIRNSLAGSQSVLLFQGTYNASNDLEIPAGVDMVVKFDGAGASATVTDVFTKLRATEITTPTLTAGTADINGGSVDGATVGAASASTGAFTTLTASTSLNIASSTTVDGVLDEDNMASDSATKLATQQSIKAYVDSQVGTVDTLAEILANGNTSGANNLIINSGQALTTNTINETTAGSGVTIDSVLLKDDVVNATDIETSNISANDGTAAATIANSTGNFTITNFISNSVDIGGGAIDGTNIGASSRGSGAFTTLTSNSTTEIAGAATFTANVDTTSSTGLQLKVGKISAVPSDVTDAFVAIHDTGGPGSLAGDLVLIPRSSNTIDNAVRLYSGYTTPVERFAVGYSEAVFNDPGNDYDFRVESTSNTNMLFVDAGNNRVGIGKVPLVTSLDVSTSMNIQGDASPSGDGLALGDYGTTGSYKWIQSFNSQPLRLNPLGNEVSIGISGVGANFKTFGNTVINEDGGDNDFRVESDSNEFMLFVDAGSNHVNIGTSSDFGGTLNVNGGGVFDDADTLDPDTMGNGRLGIGQINDGGGFAAPGFCIAGVNGNTAAVVSAGGNMYLGTGDGVNANSLTTRLLLNGLEAVFNDESLDTDFRVESNNNTHMLFVDALNDQVIVGTSTPVTGVGAMMAIGGGTDTRLAIDGSSSSGLYLTDSGAQSITIRNASGDLEFYGVSGGEFVFNEAASDTNFRVESASNAYMLFVDAGANHVNIGNSSDLGALFNVSGNAFITGNGTSVAYPSYARLAIEGGDTNSTRWGDGDKATVAIRGSEMRTDEWYPTLNIATIRQSLTTGSNATGGIGFTTIDDSNAQGIDDAARIEIYNLAPSGRNSATGIRFWTNPGGVLYDVAPQQVLQIDNTATVFNEGSYDTDFRVESDSNANMLFVDASTDRVHIGGSNVGDGELNVNDMIRISGAAPELRIDIGSSGYYLQLTEEYNFPKSIGHIRSVANTSYDGQLQFSANQGGGAYRELARMDYVDGTVFNETSVDIDFRVESDTNSHAFFVDAGNGALTSGGTSLGGYNQTSGNGQLAYLIDNGSVFGSLILSSNADRGWSMMYANKFAYSSGDDQRLIAWYVNGGALANLQLNAAGTQVEYNTGSDRRLKENIVDIDDGITRLKQMQPRKYTWVGTDLPAEGFIADEADGIVPEAVKGEVGAVDDEGNPIYQQIEYSRYVPLLTAALKEAVAKIEVLEARVAQLESN